MEKMLMETNTGAVDTESNWHAEWLEAKANGTLAELGWPENWEDNELVEVVRDENGNWVEA